MHIKYFHCFDLSFARDLRSSMVFANHVLYSLSLIPHAGSHMFSPMLLSCFRQLNQLIPLLFFPVSFFLYILLQNNLHLWLYLSSSNLRYLFPHLLLQNPLNSVDSFFLLNSAMVKKSRKKSNTFEKRKVKIIIKASSRSLSWIPFHPHFPQSVIVKSICRFLIAE